MRLREPSTREGLLVYTGAPMDLVELHSGAARHQQAAEHLSSCLEGINSKPAAVRTFCMAAMSMRARCWRPVLPYAVPRYALLNWTGLSTAGDAKHAQKAHSSTHALGDALEYSAGLYSRSSTGVRSSFLHQHQ